MKGALRHIVAKEITDNFRDRRTLVSALLFGPLFGPVIFVAVISLSLSRAVSDVEKPLELPIVGADHAPGLIAFLEQHNVEPTDPPAPAGTGTGGEGAEAAAPAAAAEGVARAAAVESVRAGDIDLALVIPPAFGEELRSGRPARLELVVDEANTRASTQARRARQLLNGWNETVAALRLQARGLSPFVVRPLAIDTVDVSTPTGRSAVLLGMLTYFLIFSMLVGGMYLAIDTTAGERERGSLEPLLTLPVERGTLITGKIFATCFYMVLSLTIALVAFSVALGFVPLEDLGMTANFGPLVVVKAFLLLSPFVLLGAALMTVVASFTKSYKEAQSYVSALLLLPTLPIMVAALLTLRPNLALMTVPSLSQHLLFTDLIKDEPLDPLFIAVSVTTTLALGLALLALAARLYRREGLLG